MEFNPKQQYTLEDERVLLRPLESSDIDHLRHFAIEEPDTWKYSLVSLVGLEGMKSYIDSAVEERDRGNEYPFIVYDKQQQQYAGCTRFYNINPKYNTLQLGYTWYGKNFQGTGLNRHCKFLLLTFAFEQLGVDRVEFRADADNTRSVAAMKAIGCTVEGILRSHMPKPDGTRRNSIVLSIIKSDWFGSVKAKLSQML